ncbi:hypothetical protein ACHAWF_007348 [Thalassiosira exigua]
MGGGVSIHRPCPFFLEFTPNPRLHLKTTGVRAEVMVINHLTPAEIVFIVVSSNSSNIARMEELSIANERLEVACEKYEQDFNAEMEELKSKERSLKERLEELNNQRFDPDQANFDVFDDDIVEVNAGGEIVSAKRSTLTQIKGTNFEALFSGRWDNKLQRDGDGRIFLDVNPVCFRAIVDYLSEMAISSVDCLPAPPTVDEEHKHILWTQLDLFGLWGNLPSQSKIIKDDINATQIHDWLEENGSDGGFTLLYRGSRDGLSGADFHSKCDNMGCTLTIIETTDGHVVGGYTNNPWTSYGSYRVANKAFLFALSGQGIASPCKVNLKNAGGTNAIYDDNSYGPTFGSGHDLYVNNNMSQVKLYFGRSFHAGPSSSQLNSCSSFNIKEIEVFEVSGISSRSDINEAHTIESVTRFSDDINGAINGKRQSLRMFESELLNLEERFTGEQKFIDAFATSEAKDIVTLNVSGKAMVTSRSTLQTADGSVLAQQFDDSLWTEQGYDMPRVKEWTVDQVSHWAESIYGIPEDVIEILKENEIKGCELLALKKDGLMALGITRTGTLYLLLEEIKNLEKASQTVATFIEHSPYCFGKILDYLRLKHLHSKGLVEEPTLPQVRQSEQSRFDKVVKYYFPGNRAKFILG